MKIKEKQVDDIKVIKLIGDLDGTTAEEVQEKLITYVSSESKLIFDMANCEYISSAGLRVLLIIAKKLKREGGFGILANLLEEVKDVMEMTGFSHIFPICDNIDEAIVSVKKEA